MSKNTFLEFSPKTRKIIKERDGGCIFCQYAGYSGFPPTQIMHYIPRSRMGMGIEENGAYGCAKHHQELDNGMKSMPMKKYFKEYLKSKYPDWDETKLIYSKWGFIGGK